jgi:hypothetical protein
MEIASQPALARTVSARHDLDWLPPSMKAVRWTVAGTIWTGIAGLTIGTLALSKFHIYFWGKGIAALVAGGYYAGDRAARTVLRRRLGKLARGAVDLSRLQREEDGELLHVRGKVRAHQAILGLTSEAPGVYRRVVFSIGGSLGARVVHEAAVDFSIVDASGERVTVQVEDARLLAPEPRRIRLDEATVRKLAELPLPDKLGRVFGAWLLRAAAGKRVQPVLGSEVLLQDGDEVELVGYKTRVVDPTVGERLERETPMRATLRSGRDLPLLIAPSK